MKRIIAMATAATIAAATLTGCYGKFALTRKVYQVNGQVSDKFLRSAVTWAFIIVPVYGVVAFVDFVLFNTIEFWSGHNPVAFGEKDFQYAEGEKQFSIHATKTAKTVSYAIQRTGTSVDRLEIRWDLASGNSTAVHFSNGKTTEYSAVSVEGETHLASRVVEQSNLLAFNR